MKETLRKERGEGQSLKRKHDDILTKLEKLKDAYKILETEKDALVLLATITEGEKKDLERKVLELEKKKYTANKRVEELEIQKSLLDKQIKEENEIQLDVAPFQNQAPLLQKEINQIQLNLVE